MVLVLAMLSPGAISRLFERSPMRHWGKIIFTVYLLHSFVINTQIWAYYAAAHNTLLFDRIPFVAEGQPPLQASECTHCDSQTGPTDGRCQVLADGRCVL